MVDTNTTIYDVNLFKQELIMMTINEIIKALEYKGYNATKQLVGYLLTGDESYITSYNSSRKKIKKFSREEILMALINGYLGK